MRKPNDENYLRQADLLLKSVLLRLLQANVPDDDSLASYCMGSQLYTLLLLPLL